MDKIQLISITDFCKVIPQDWSEELLDQWDRIKHNTKIFGCFIQGKLVGGAILTSSVTSDVLDYESIATSYFNKNFYYLAYFFIDEKYRGQNVGKLWLSQFLLEHKQKSIWLSTDHERLFEYYLAQGFKLNTFHEGTNEWIMDRINS